jgi:hypothetical protein
MNRTPTAQRGRQDTKWGEQNHPDGTGPQFVNRAAYERIRTETAAIDGTLTFRHVLAEEVAEAYAENDPERPRAELVQVAATAACWIQAIDRRAATRWSLPTAGQPHPILTLLKEAH